MNQENQGVSNTKDRFLVNNSIWNTKTRTYIIRDGSWAH